ncbi:hypothetical protein RJ55_04394 [Drechmeria coniospora]|nr:hypothetical protein RJ55_04394 [Drechmeria coniospora]
MVPIFLGNCPATFCLSPDRLFQENGGLNGASWYRASIVGETFGSAHVRAGNDRNAVERQVRLRLRGRARTDDATQQAVAWFVRASGSKGRATVSTTDEVLQLQYFTHSIEGAEQPVLPGGSSISRDLGAKEYDSFVILMTPRRSASGLPSKYEKLGTFLCCRDLLAESTTMARHGRKRQQGAKAAVNQSTSKSLPLQRMERTDRGAIFGSNTRIMHCGYVGLTLGQSKCPGRALEGGSPPPPNPFRRWPAIRSHFWQSAQADTASDRWF